MAGSKKMPDGRSWWESYNIPYYVFKQHRQSVYAALFHLWNQLNIVVTIYS